MAANNAVSLSELINDVANELRLAQSLSQDKSPVMEFTECELELQVNVSVEGKAGIKFWLLDIGGRGKHEKTHTIKIKFNSLKDKKLAYQVVGKKAAKPITKQ